MKLFILSILCLFTSAFSVSAFAQMPQSDLNDFLFRASISGDEESVRFALEAGADVYVTSEKGCTPLMNAIHGHSCGNSSSPRFGPVAEMLVEAGALKQISASHLSEFFRVLNYFGETEYATEHTWKAFEEMSQEQLDTLLLDTTSFQMIEYSDVWSVKTLIEAGANVNVTDENGCTPLLNAVGAILCGYDSNTYHNRVVNILFRAGAGLSQLSSDQLDSLLMQVSAFGPIEYVRIALDAGANVSGGFPKEDFRPLPPLFRASENCRENIVRVLVVKGAPVNMRVGEGEWTALDVAKENCDEGDGVLRVLQDAGGFTSVRPVIP